MALQECGLNLNRVSRELQAHGTTEFPCAGYESTHTNQADDVIPWHWHEEFEVVCILEGQMKLMVPNRTIHLKAGEICFINANILHYAEGDPKCTLQSFVFHPYLISGNDYSAIYRRYMSPIIEHKGLLIWQPKEPTGFFDSFRTAFDTLKEDSFGYELTVQRFLSKIIQEIVFDVECDLIKEEVLNSSDPDSQRIRIMLEYIHEHFGDPLSVQTIAESANLSDRECHRCFQRTIQVSPTQYLLKYRIMKAAEMLLSLRQKTISEIALDCGFESPSNFSMLFKRYYQMTPKQYRNTKQVGTA